MKHHRPFRAKQRDILIAAAIIVLLIAGAAYRFSQRSSAPEVLSEPSSAASAAPSASEYRSSASVTVQSLADAARGGEISGVAAQREQLLALRVPKEYKELHLQLILTADALLAGDTRRAEVLLSQAENDNSWLKN